MLDEHLGYISDGIRLRHLGTAIAKAVRPGDVVLDLGCGSGVLGLLSLQSGASRVIAIDSTAMIEVAVRRFDARVLLIAVNCVAAGPFAFRRRSAPTSCSAIILAISALTTEL